MELDFIKKYLRIDYDEDDDYIKLLLEVAKEYIENAIGHCDFEKARVKLVALNIMSTLYEDRAFTIDKKNEKVAYTIKNIMMQLSLESGT